MAALAPGILLKLLNGMNDGEKNPVGENRCAFLQVTDIVPVDLDEKDLMPKHGFYIKVSDSSQSIYVSLPTDHDDLVLSNKIQLGQFISVDRLKPGNPVPIIYGVKPLPGRHPLIGTPEPIVGNNSRGDKSYMKEVKSRQRCSWESEKKPAIVASTPMVVKPKLLDFDASTPTPVRMSSKGGKLSRLRFSVSEVLQTKMAEFKESGSSLMCKSSALSKFSRGEYSSGTESKTAKSPFSTEKKNLLTLSSGVRAKRPIVLSESKKNSSNHSELPGKLSHLQKEAVMNRERAQKIAHQALRNASATENVVRVFKIFSDLVSVAGADSAVNVLSQYLHFHEKSLQVVADMEKIQGAIQSSGESENGIPVQSIFQEISNYANSPKRRGSDIKSSNGQQLRTNPTKNTSNEIKIGPAMLIGEGNIQVPSSLSISVKLVQDFQTAAGKWFMDFLEVALDPVKRKKREAAQSSIKCPQSLILKVINWVEMEQSNGSKRPAHPRAAFVARRLRIKSKDPSCLL